MSKSTQRERERALFRYRNALESGDFDTVAEMLRLAERDSDLVRMIAELHELDDVPPEREQTKNGIFTPRRGITEVHLNHEPSPNGWPPLTDNLEEDNTMFTTFDDTIQKGNTRLQFLTAIAAALILIVLGTILLDMASRFAPSQENLSVAAAAQSPEPEIAGCQVMNNADVKAESVRLANEATTLMQAQTPDTELAMLLSICALQTEYSQQADTALQLALTSTQLIPEFPGQTAIGNSAVFSPDGRYLMIAGYEEAHLWDIASATEVRTFTYNFPSPVAFSPDGKYFLSSFEFDVARLWDTETGESIREFDAGSEIISVAYAPDGTHIALGLITGEVQVWNAEKATLERSLAVHHSGAIVSFSPDSHSLLIGGDHGRPYPVYLMDAESGTEIRTFLGLRDFSNGIVFSPDGRYVLAGGDTSDRRALLWDAETGEELRVFSGYINDINTVAISPDSQYALVGSADKTVGLWHIETGTEIRRFKGNPSFIASVAFSPDGNMLLIGSTNKAVRLWHSDYRNMIALACENVARDFTEEERAQYGISDGAPTCPQFGENYVLPEGMSPMPTQPIPVWTPLPPLEGTGS